jgi:ATPase subunit of ABC transporter with duplicated ATPase domains
MTSSVSLTLQGVSFHLPDGRALFSGLSEVFDCRRTGLVGRNGIGKSVLARILAGGLQPSQGRCLRTGSVRYLPQQIAPRPGETVADLAGVRTELDALARIEAGSTRQADFDAVGERWDLRQQFRQALARGGLDHVTALTPSLQLSGGEAMRVAVAGALMSGADFLILDEPTNHLDREQRSLLLEQLQRWSGGLLVVSHDRELLESMTRIVELSSLGLRSYGGGYSFYAQASAQERAQAQAELARRKAVRQREERALQAQRERLARRQARGARAADDNLPAILLGLRKSSAEVNSGKLRTRQDAVREMLSQRVREAAQQVADDEPIVLFAPDSAPPAPDRVAVLSDVVLPHLEGAAQHVDMVIARAQRIALVGPNGCGKSTLLKVLAGRVPPQRGRAEVFVETAYLDQRLSTLDARTSILQQLLALSTRVPEGELRVRLALLGLDADRVALPAGLLSGGERLKAALARVLYADRPAQLLLLDEPDNHLDLDSKSALESVLRQYRGALVVVSHDAAFLDAIQPTHRMAPTAREWILDGL